MLKKIILTLAMAASTTLIPNTAQAVVHVSARRYPRGYYYSGGRWRPYRGYGHPYRGGFYDRWGRWHRY